MYGSIGKSNSKAHIVLFFFPAQKKNIYTYICIYPLHLVLLSNMSYTGSKIQCQCVFDNNSEFCFSRIRGKQWFGTGVNVNY